MFFYTPCKQNLGGFIWITLFIGWCSCVQFISLLWSYITIYYFTQRLYITWCCFKILTQDHLGKFMVTGSESALFVSGLYLSYGEKLEISTSHKHKDVPWFWTKVIHASSRSMEVKVHNSCLLYTFLMGTHCKFLLHTKIAYGLMACHDLV